VNGEPACRLAYCRRGASGETPEKFQRAGIQPREEKREEKFRSPAGALRLDLLRFPSRFPIMTIDGPDERPERKVLRAKCTGRYQVLVPLDSPPFASPKSALTPRHSCADPREDSGLMTRGANKRELNEIQSIARALLFSLSSLLTPVTASGEMTVFQ